MAADIPIESDLTLVFERDDVQAALVEHCGRAHVGAGIKNCESCRGVSVVLVMAIVDWLAMVDQDRAARLRGDE